MEVRSPTSRPPKIAAFCAAAISVYQHADSRAITLIASHSSLQEASKICRTWHLGKKKGSQRSARDPEDFRFIFFQNWINWYKLMWIYQMFVFPVLSTVNVWTIHWPPASRMSRNSDKTLWTSRRKITDSSELSAKCYEIWKSNFIFVDICEIMQTSVNVKFGVAHKRENLIDFDNHCAAKIRVFTYKHWLR